MKIVQINMVTDGSTGKIMFQIAEHAQIRGHKVFTFSPANYNRNQSEKNVVIKNHLYFGTSFENMLHHYFAKITGLQGFLSIFGTYSLIKQLKKISPDIVHLHNFHNRSVCVPLLFNYFKKSGVKVVWTLHDCWAFTGQCPHFTMVKCDKWMNGCYSCPQTGVYPEALVDNTRFMWKQKKKWFTNLDNMMLVTPSEWLAELVKHSFLKDYPLKVINNGIDLRVFHMTQNNFRDKYNLHNKRVLLGVSFGWGERKGLDVFVRLANELDPKYQIVLVGTNNVTEAILPDNIISICKTNNQSELAEIYSAADLFINPTREDNYPTVNMEAIACGTPVLTFRTGGSPEIVNTQTGSVVDCDDFEALKTEIEKLCSETESRKESCLAFAEKFDMNEKFNKYIELYEQIVYDNSVKQQEF